ncbi:MAG: hypothetical protein OK474_08670, partial [Thaumarchaeota archaeon]|nr:hypothetical protein [Nitrososphaerota archaeon]
AVASLSGIPPLSGFWSKDAVLALAWSSGQTGLFIVGSLTAGITAFYAFRLLGIVFFGQRSKHLSASEGQGEGLHEPGPLSRAPYVLLASGTVAIGLLALVGFEGSLGSAANAYLESLFTAGSIPDLTGPTPSFEFLPALITLVIVAVGVLVAAQLYVTRRLSAERLIGSSSVLLGLHRFLENRWYINAVYYKVFVDAPLKASNWTAIHFEQNVLQRVNTGGEALGMGLSGAGIWFDRNVVDAVASGVSGAGQYLSRVFRRLQTGVLESYALVLVLGLAAMLVLLVVLTGLYTAI